LGPGVEAPAARDQAQLEAAPLHGVLVGQLPQGVGDLPLRALQYLRQVLLGGGLVHDHEDRLEGGLELETGDVARPRGRLGGVLAHFFCSSSGCSGGRSNSSVTVGVSSPSPPVQRTSSSPRAVSCSSATAFSRYSSSSARNRATTVRVSPASSTSTRNDTSRSSFSRATTIPACSCTLTRGAWMWSTYTCGLGLGCIAF